ncbi:ABC transporter ATP-binding protein [Macrococcus hajekii]|nr:ABC transporter ATP-binding protein [Macrococcus hajekii]GGB07427.1 ABC transporter ATP-binding protein [Macrococcus hajekii]
MTETVLTVTDLVVDVKEQRLVDQVSFSINRGQILGLVGESGCGKTMTSKAIMQLHPSHVETTGHIRLFDQELNEASDKVMRQIRGNIITLIMQNPMSAFNPVFTIGQQFIETIRTHRRVSKKEARQLAVNTMLELELTEPDRIMKSYPFELSGGMLQRVMIAMAACMEPALIIADEPTTALDLHSQKRVLMLLEKVRAKWGTAILLISHDLSVIAEMADEVAVMKDGRIIEKNDVINLFDAPAQPYTKQLLTSRLSLYTTKKPYSFDYEDKVERS